MNIKRLGLFWFLVNISLVWSMKTEGVFRRKRQQCADGAYKKMGFDCCRCPKGHYVKEHCSAQQQTMCAQCVSGTFMSHPNSEQTCETCKDCQSTRNLEVANQCTDQTNTVCKCKSGYFCDKGEECFICYACEKCEGLGVKVPCTATNNTVCSDEVSRKGPIIGTIVGILVIAVVVAVVLWKMDYCKGFIKKESRGEPDMEMVPLSDDVDLTPYLHKIARLLKIQVVKNVARRCLIEAEIERPVLNHPNDTEEQAYKLLEAWYQKHGLRGACNSLINALKEEGRNSDASRVERIIKDGEEIGLNEKNVRLNKV
ncbi:tumor necrosis factor receptor superfamily member 6 [Brachyhypopomus gauderio]|uniref:tumor necrosis factor receptor superfamily member 6 n=1 Tax=Brachyhypopomus gauderio TaxID=698409 RepID=UPI0040433518